MRGTLITSSSDGLLAACYSRLSAELAPSSGEHRSRPKGLPGFTGPFPSTSLDKGSCVVRCADDASRSLSRPATAPEQRRGEPGTAPPRRSIPAPAPPSRSGALADDDEMRDAEPPQGGVLG